MLLLWVVKTATRASSAFSRLKKLSYEDYSYGSVQKKSLKAVYCNRNKQSKLWSSGVSTEGKVVFHDETIPSEVLTG